VFIAGKLKSRVAAGPQIMLGARPYQHWPRQSGQEFFTHGQAANGFITVAITIPAAHSIRLATTPS
jgi:hypothetical protein